MANSGTLHSGNMPGTSLEICFDWSISNINNSAGTATLTYKLYGVSNSNIEYKYLIIATGRSPRKLDILNDYVGKGVSYCALCDGNLYKNKDVMVIGGGDVAFEEALYLSNIVNSVIILNRSNHLRAEQKEQIKVKETKNIKVINNIIWLSSLLSLIWIYTISFCNFIS